MDQLNVEQARATAVSQSDTAEWGTWNATIRLKKLTKWSVLYLRNTYLMRFYRFTRDYRLPGVDVAV